MSHLVAKPFMTLDRRFSAGQEVSPADIAGHLDFPAWVDRGFIVLRDGMTAEPPTAEALDTEAPEARDAPTSEP